METILMRRRQKRRRRRNNIGKSGRKRRNNIGKRTGRGEAERDGGGGLKMSVLERQFYKA
jgi:hypothetical protein